MKKMKTEIRQKTKMKTEIRKNIKSNSKYELKL